MTFGIEAFHKAAVQTPSQENVEEIRQCSSRGWTPVGTPVIWRTVQGQLPTVRTSTSISPKFRRPPMASRRLSRRWSETDMYLLL